MFKRKKSLVAGISFILFLAVFLAGCSKIALYHNLTEEEANEIIVVLYEHDINATKEKEVVQNETTYAVTVDAKVLARARKILVDRNLPSKRELGLGGVYKDKGLIPTPDEQKARFLLAIKGEIVNSLKKMPEVVDADVVINVPTPEEFKTGEAKRPTASVMIKLRSDMQGVSQITEGRIQQYVANSVENLNPRDVAVMISYVALSKDNVGAIPSEGTKLVLPESGKKEETRVPGEKVSVAGIMVDKGSAIRLKIYLSLFFGLFVVLAAILIVGIVRTIRMKQEIRALTEGGSQNLLEGETEPPRRLGPGENDNDS